MIFHCQLQYGHNNHCYQHKTTIRFIKLFNIWLGLSFDFGIACY